MKAIQSGCAPVAYRYRQSNQNGGGYWVLLDAAFPETGGHRALEPLYSEAAIVAERERCAVIAEGSMGVPARQNIAASIRGGQTLVNPLVAELRAALDGMLRATNFDQEEPWVVAANAALAKTGSQP